MAEGARKYFGSIAEGYDSIARRGMPRYDEMLDKIIEVSPDRAHDVLELGCGTGALTVRLRERYADANLVAVDGAKEMLDVARERVSQIRNAQHRDVEFELRAFEEIEPTRQRYDFIASNMSLHHVKDKGPLYAQLWEALQPGGHLVFGDELKGALPHVEELHWNGWLEFARQPEHLSEGEIADIIKHVEDADHYETLPKQLALLTSAGFVAVDCTWRYLNYAVFVAST